MKKIINNIGIARIILFIFLLVLFIIATIYDTPLDSNITDTLMRFTMNSIFVLALLPMIKGGCGLNLGLSLGVIAGILGAIISLELNLISYLGFLIALIIGIFFAIIFGYLYGLLLNKVKGDEMIIATYVGFSVVAFMCIMWLLLPFKNATMIWAIGGTGLRTSISVENYWLHILDNYLSFNTIDIFTKLNLIDKIALDIQIPTGTILFFMLLSFAVYLFFNTKTGIAMSATGSNPVFAKSNGINIDKMRILSVILSTCLGAIGIIVYEQSFGFIQLYNSPLYMPFPAIAAILLGGASVNKSTLSNVIIGTFLFQGILTMTPTVINSIIETDNISEVLRIIISNGMILYALTRKTR